MRQNLILLAIVLLAALFRGYNLDYALPEIYEEATPMHQAWEMWHWGGEGFDLNPRFFNYPALFFYFQLFAQVLYFWGHALIGRFDSPLDMRRAFDADPTELVLLARLVTVAFGLGIVWATHRLGRACGGPLVAQIAAAIVAIAQIPIAASRTILVDTPLVFFGALALAETVQPQPDLRRSLRCGLWIGLAASAKYTGALFVVPFLAAHLLAHRFQRLHQLAWGLCASAGAFLITSPYCLLDFHAFWADFSYERTHMAMGHFGVDASRTVLTYAQDLYHSLEFGLIPAAIVGLLWMAFPSRGRRKRTLPLLAFTAVYAGAIATWSVHAAHYLLPLFPPLAVAAALGIRRMAPRISRSAWTPAAVSILLLAPTGAQSIRHLADSRRPDARTAARQWIETHVPPGALLAKEFYTPELPPERYLIARLPMDVLRPEAMALFYDLGWYVDFDYIIISGDIAKRYKSDPDRFSRQIRFYADLHAQWTLEKSFAGDHLSGPGVHIYRHPNAPQADPQPYPETQYEVLVGANQSFAQGLLGQFARLFQKRGWHDKAIDVYNHLIAIAPERADLRAEQGMMLFEAGYIFEAEQLFTQALEGDLTRPDYVRGLRFFIRGQPDSAAAAWEHDRRQHQNDVALLANLGAVYFQQGDTARAVDLWERALVQNPMDTDLVNNLVFIYSERNQPERAAEILQNALVVQPNNPDLRAALNALHLPSQK